MPEILINNFSPGLISQPADTDLPDGAALVAQNVDLEDPGKLKNQKGNLLDIAGPTGVTILSVIKFEWNLPSPFGRKETRILYGTDGAGRDELWWNPYWDTVTAAWVVGWQELTEFEGPFTMSNIAAGAVGDTDTTNVYDLASLSSVTDNYYNTWLLLNVTRQKSMVIFDYDGSNRQLILQVAIASQAVGDKYILYRFPLIMSLEGPYVTDTNTTTTSLVDSQLRSNAEEHYTGYKINNTTRSIEVTVTGYDAKNKTLTHPTITGQVATDNYYIYKETHSIRADVVRFFPRQNAIEISLGNNEGYPLKAPLWFGFISKREYLSKVALNDTTFEGFWLDRNVMQAPDVSVVDAVDGGGGTLAADSYHFKASYIYDGYQESPLSAVVSPTQTGTNEFFLDFNIPLYFSDSTNKPGIFDAMLDRRITHGRIYAAKGDSDDASDNYFLFISTPIVNIELPIDGKQNWTQVAGVYEQVGAFNFNDNTWANGVFVETTTDKIVYGKFLRWDHNQGHTSESVDANFKFKALLQEVHYKTPVFTDIQRDAFIQYSIQSNGQGVPVDDVMAIQNFISLSIKGVVETTGIVSIGGFIIIITPRKLFRYAPGQQLLEFPIERGGVSEKGSVEIDDILYFTAIEDFYAFDGHSAPRRLMFGRILDKWRTITDANKKLAIVEYNKKTNSIWALVGGTIFIYDIDFNRWRTHSTSLSITGFFRGINDELFAFTTSNIYEMESDTFTEAITFNWQSKVFSFAKEVGGRFLPAKAAIKRMVMKYKGDRQITAELFDPSLSSLPLRKVKFFPQTLSKDIARETNFETTQLKISLTDIDNSEVQPATAIDYIKIEYDILTP